MTSETPLEHDMKTVIIILSVVTLGLGLGFVLRQTKSHEQLEAAARSLHWATNQIAETRSRLTEQEQLAQFLQTSLSQRAADLAVASNNIATAQANLTTTQTELKAAQAEVQKQQVELAELKTERDGLSLKMSELAGSINTLEGQITETRRKLASAEGDRDYLTKQLAQLQSDKTELLRQFNDLAVLRAQVAHLREEQALNRRLAWMSKGIYQHSGRKGAEALIHRPASESSTTEPASAPGLDVELRQKGGVQVIEPEQKPAQP